MERPENFGKLDAMFLTPDKHSDASETIHVVKFMQTFQTPRG
jgi:hypothetical protein